MEHPLPCRRRVRAGCRLAAWLVAALAWQSPAAAPAAPFAPDSVWNAPLGANAPVVPSSPQLVAELRRQVALPAGAWINTTSYSVPVYTVPAGQARVRVQLDAAYPPLQRDFEAVPVPPDARPALGSDAHLTVYQPSSDTLWELWQMAKRGDGWHARWGGRMSGVASSPGYFTGGAGATATGLPLLGGLIRADELRAGHIDHALALAIPAAKANAFVWPAQRGDGAATGAAAIPEGTRFRLDPALNVDSLHLPAAAAILAKAVQRYGMVVRDRAGAVVFYAEDPWPLGHDPYGPLFGGLWANQLLEGFPWDRLEVVVPDRAVFARAPTPAAPAPPARAASAGGRPRHVRSRPARCSRARRARSHPRRARSHPHSARSHRHGRRCRRGARVAAGRRSNRCRHRSRSRTAKRRPAAIRACRGHRRR